MRNVLGTIFLLISLSSLAQDFDIEVSNKVFRNVFTKPAGSLIENQSSFNINSRITISRRIPFGKVLFGIGYSTFNYVSFINIDEFDSPDDPSFNSFETTRKSNGNQFLTIPLGVRFYLNESIYLPFEAGLNISLRNDSGIFNKQFVSIATGIGFIKTLGEKLSLSIEPDISLYFEATQNPEWTSRMPLTYGLRFNIAYIL